MGIFDKDNKFLTEKNGLGGFELKICMNCNPDAENKACGSCKFFQDAIDRLAAYEASGLTPKQVMKLKKAADKGEIKEGKTTLPVFDMADPDCGKKIEAWEREEQKQEVFAEQGFARDEKTEQVFNERNEKRATDRRDNNDKD